VYCEACLQCWSPSPAALGKETARNLDNENKTGQQKQCFGSGLDRDSNESADPEDWEFGSGSRQVKSAPKKGKKLRNFMIEESECLRRGLSRHYGGF
jgi:hypothetical protein